MDVLIFCTDRFPYGKGEAFIENEIPYLARRFDKIIVVPMALTVSEDTKRALPDNFIILPPANTDDLYKSGRPTRTQRVMWSVKYMLPWCVSAAVSSDTMKEISRMIKHHESSASRVVQHIRTMGQIKRNESFFSKFKAEIPVAANVYIYSYWLSYGTKYIEKTLRIKHNNVKKRLCRAHGYDLYSERRECKYIPFQENAIDYFDKVCMISRNGLDYIREKYPEYTKKYALHYLGTKDYGQGYYNPDEKAFHIVSCSYVIPVKRVDRIVDALSSINGINIRWSHFGAGQDFEKLKNYAKILDDNPYISYEFKGQILNQELMSYYQTHSVSLFVNVSSSEGLPVSIMEAISFGIPVVATDVGGTADAVENGVNGILLKENFSNEELREAILKIADSENYLDYRRKAREIWMQRFYESSNYPSFIKENFGENI